MPELRLARAARAWLDRLLAITRWVAAFPACWALIAVPLLLIAVIHRALQGGSTVAAIVWTLILLVAMLVAGVIAFFTICTS